MMALYQAEFPKAFVQVLRERRTFANQTKKRRAYPTSFGNDPDLCGGRFQSLVGGPELLLLTDRMSQARQLQKVLQRAQPCDIAALTASAAPPPHYELIVCDVALDLPKSIEALQAALAQYRHDATTPVLFLLRDPSHVTLGQARLAGATATLAHAAPAGMLLAAVTGLMAAERAGSAWPDPAGETRAGVKQVGRLLTELFHSGATLAPISADNLTQAGELLLDTIKHADIQTWLDIVWAYDDATYQHCLLVAGFTASFALELALPPKQQQLLAQAALIHDIGKARVPRNILNKAGRLTPTEMAIMRGHADAGYRMLLTQPRLDPQLLDVVRHHHEYLDGSGYPDGLQALQISRPVRIVTVCDIYAALVERRLDKTPLTPKLALDHLDGLGSKLDQALVKAFRNVVRET